ncbi:unnamed protein product, partial [Notodromas monacha]
MKAPAAAELLDHYHMYARDAWFMSFEIQTRDTYARDIFALGIKMLRFPLFAISLIALNSLLTPAFAGWSAKGGGGGGARCAGGGCARKLSATGGSGSGGSPYWWQDSKPFSNPDHGSGGSHQPSGNYPQQQQQQQFQNTCNPGYECVSYDRCDNGIVVPHGSAGQIDLRGKPNKNINALGSPCGNNQPVTSSSVGIANHSKDVVMEDVDPATNSTNLLHHKALAVVEGMDAMGNSRFFSNLSNNSSHNSNLALLSRQGQQVVEVHQVVVLVDHVVVRSLKCTNLNNLNSSSTQEVLHQVVVLVDHVVVRNLKCTNLNSSSTQEVLHQVVVLVDHVEDSNLKCTNLNNLNSNSTQEALHQVVALVDHVVASNLKYTQVHNLDHKSQYQVDALEGLVEVSDPKFNHLDHKLAHHLQVVALVDHVVANNLKCTNLSNHSKFPSQEDVVDLAILVEDKDNKHINLSLNPVPALVDSNLSQQDQGVAVLEPLDVGNRDLRFNQQDFQTIISMPVQPPNIARQPFPSAASAGGNQNSINANFKPYTGPTAAPVPFAGCSA